MLLNYEKFDNQITEEQTSQKTRYLIETIPVLSLYNKLQLVCKQELFCRLDGDAFCES